MATDNTIHCAEHGEATTTYVCEHLLVNSKQRWNCDYPSEQKPWPDAWCEQCDAAFQQEGEWNEKNENAVKIKLICHYCYESGIGSSVDCVEETTAESWVRTVSNYYRQLCSKQELLESQFNLSKHKRWDYDQETGLLTFSNDGVPAVISNIEMIGSVSIASGTWLWSWANFSLLPNVRERIVAVRDFGEDRGFPRLTIPKWTADEVAGWEISAVATQVLDARGVYCVPTDQGFLFMALMNVWFAT